MISLRQNESDRAYLTGSSAWPFGLELHFIRDSSGPRIQQERSLKEWGDMDLILSKDLEKDELGMYIAYFEKLDAHKRTTDSLAEADLNNRKLTYLSCAVPAIKKWASIKHPEAECEDLIIYTVKNDTLAYRNNVFTFSLYDKSFSLQTNLYQVDKNIYDSRFLGTWHTSDFKVFFHFYWWRNQNGFPFYAKIFVYDDKNQKYWWGIEREKQPFYLANIDSTFLFEYNLEKHIGNKDMQLRIPFVYKLTDDRHMTVKPISYNYKLPLFTFASKFDYRKYIQQNIGKPDFFGSTLYLTRMTEDTAEIARLPAIQKGAFFSIAEQLMQGDRMDNPFNDPKKTRIGQITNFHSNQKAIIGYDVFQNPVYENGIKTGGELYVDASGNR